jgi:rubredoxin
MTNTTVTLLVADIASTTTAALLSFFNAHADKPAARFADRATAVRRVTALIEQIEATRVATAATSSAAKRAAKKATKVVAAYVANSNVCPKCGADKDQTAAGLEGHSGEDRNFCHHCGTEYHPESGKVYHAPAASATRSGAIAKSWADPATAAARAERNHVVVNKIEYRSVLQAFQQLGLPVSKHIAFRGQLKASEGGKLAFQGTIFKLVPAAE